MAIPDPMAALRTFLLADAGVSGEVSTRVYTPELPASETQKPAQKAIVIRQSGGAGGLGSNSYLAIGVVRVDVFNYGATFADAHAVRMASYEAMKKMKRNDSNSTLLYSAAQSSGPTDVRFPSTDWPCVIETWLVTAGEVALT